MATSLDKLKIARFGKLHATDLMGDLKPDASVKDLVFKAQDSILVKPNKGMGADALKKFKVIGTADIDGALQVDNVTLDGNTVSTVSGNLALSSHAGTVRVSDVVMTAAALAPSSDVDISITGGATKSVLMEGVKFTDNAVTTSSGTLAISSAGSSAAALKLGGVTVTDASLSASKTDLNMNLVSNGTGAVLVDNVRVKTSGIGNNVADADLSITSNGTGSVTVDSVKDLTLTSTAGGSGKVTTSAGNLELTSASGTVAVAGALTSSNTITSAGNAVAGGDVKVAGVLESTNATGNLEIVDKTVKLGYQKGSYSVVDAPFETKLLSPPRTENAASSGVVVYLQGNADIAGGKLVIPTTHSASCAFTAVNDATALASGGVLNWSTDDVNIEFSVTITSALTNSSISMCPIFFMENYTSPTNQLYVRMYAKGTLGKLRLEGLGLDSDAVGFLDSAGTYLIKVSTAWSGGVCLGTITFSKDGGPTIPVRFSGSPTVNLTSRLSNCYKWGVVVGSSGYAPNNQYTVDYFKMVKGTSSTNLSSDNAGLYVDGSSSYSSRALTWHAGAGETSQDKGDNTGSYWHFEGGQLLLSRTIAAADREAPGTEMNLAALASGSDDARWEFNTNAVSEVGGKTLTLVSGATVSGGVLRLNDSGTQSATCAASLPNGTFSIMAKVTPGADLSSTAANDMVLASYGGAGSGSNTAWLGRWFDDPNNLTSVANTGTGTSGSFVGVTAVSGAVTCPAQSSNTRYVQMTDLNTTGATANDGYGEWTVEARVKTSLIGNTGSFNVFWIGDDYAGSGNGARISIHCSNTVLYLGTEDSGGLGDRLLRVPFAYLEALTSAGNTPTNGAYHKYRLLRKSYTAGTQTSDPRDLFSLWYDDVEVSLQVGVNNVTLTNLIMRNTVIKAADAYLRIGGTTRQPSGQEVTVDYVSFRNAAVAASALTRVTVTNGGCLTLTDGTASVQTSQVVGETPFSMAIVRDGSLSSTRLYVDGVLSATIASSVDVGALPTLTLGPGKAHPTMFVHVDAANQLASVSDVLYHLLGLNNVDDVSSVAGMKPFLPWCTPVKRPDGRDDYLADVVVMSCILRAMTVVGASQRLACAKSVATLLRKSPFIPKSVFGVDMGGNPYEGRFSDLAISPCPRACYRRVSCCVHRISR
eukprot:jgi/Mesvir1/9985/Mv05776-RA.1